VCTRVRVLSKKLLSKSVFHYMHVMSQIEDIYKQLGGNLPSADFNLGGSEDEDEVRVHSN